MKSKKIIPAMFLVLAVIMSVFGPHMNPYGYDEQMTDFINMPPQMPILARFGVCDGSRVLYNRRTEYLSDPERYPEGSVKEVLRVFDEAGVEMCDVRVDYYKLVGAEGYSFWFGTDYLGRDLWTRLWHGARVSLFIAALSVIIAVLVGTAAGAAAGYYGGKADLLLMRAAEIIGAFPSSIIAAVLILVMGAGIRSIIIALILRGWVATARLTRAQFIRLREREYILAARALGTRDGHIIAQHILPNAAGPIITRAMAEIPEAIFAEAFLAYIGLGLQAPEPSLGILLSDAQKTLLTYPFQTFFPAVLISALMLMFNFLGNALRENLNPRQEN